MRKFVLPILFLLLILVGPSASFAQERISLRLKNKTLRDVLDTLQSITGTRIYYSSSFLPVERKVDVQINQLSQEEILAQLFPEPDVEIKHMSSGITISKKQVKLFRLFGYVREKATGENLIGVSIGDNSLRHTTQTNLYGFF